MATAPAIARYTLPQAAELTLLGGGGSTPLMMPTDRRTFIILEDKSEHELPFGTKAIYVQNRRCGDVYCSIDGKSRHVQATGETLESAFLGALAKAA